MFSSSIVKEESGETEELCLFKNPTGSGKVGFDIFLKIKTDEEEKVEWRIYHNPTVTTNGTVQTVLDDNSNTTTQNSLILYKSPVIASYGTEIRKFNSPESPLKFYASAPFLELEAGNSLLLRRTTSGGGEITTVWQWTEI